MYLKSSLVAALLLAVLCGPIAHLQAAEKESAQKSLPHLVTEDFEKGHDDWTTTDQAAWEIQTDQDNQVLALIKKRSNYKPPQRSPYNMAMLKDRLVGDFQLDVKLKSTEKDYPHRSLCLFFGYQDPSHFYYVHFGKKTDDHANQIFIVNNAARTKISTKTSPGTPWDDNWHNVRIVRNTRDGSILVYFDNMQEPVMTAKDKTFSWGQVGIGSFDDRGVFDTIQLLGKTVERKPKQ